MKEQTWIATFILLALLLQSESLHSQVPSDSRVLAWQQDLDIAIHSFLPRDRSYSPRQRTRFISLLRELQKDVVSKTDNEIIATLAQTVALSDNAHTRLYSVRNRTAVRRYPIRVWWFQEGLFVVRSRPEFTELLGARPVRINGADMTRLKGQVAPLFAGNGAWHDHMSTYSLTSPDLLAGLGVVPDSGEVEMELVTRNGLRIRRSITPLPLLGDGTYQAIALMGFSYVEGDAAAVERVQRSSVHNFQRPDRPQGARLDPTRGSLEGLRYQFNFDNVARCSRPGAFTSRCTVRTARR